MGLKLKSTNGTGSVELNAPDNHNIDTSFTLPTSNFTGGEWVLADGSGNVNIDNGTLYVDAVNDRVGVGTASPSNDLDILKTASGSTTTARIGSTAASGVNNATLILNNGGTGDATLRFDYESSTDQASIGVSASDQKLTFSTGGSTAATIDSSGVIDFVGPGYTIGTNSCFIKQDSSGEGYLYNRGNNDLLLGTNNTERMRINSAGGVGINTTSPYTAAGYGIITLNGSTGGQVRFRTANADSGIVYSNSSSLNVYAFANQDLRLHAGGVERMRITGAGEVYINNNVQDASVGSSCKLQVRCSAPEHTAVFRNINSAPYGPLIVYDYDKNNTSHQFLRCDGVTTTRLEIRSNGGIANYQSNNVNLCDEREKKNIETLDSTWGCLKNWELKKFHYNEDADTDDKRYGVIAQQVAEHCPEVITEWVKQKAKDAVLDDDGNIVTPAVEEINRMGVKEQQMMWMAIKALQEAQARIETLETQNASFEARLAALEGGTTE